MICNILYLLCETSHSSVYMELNENSTEVSSRKLNNLNLKGQWDSDRQKIRH